MNSIHNRSSRVRASCPCEMCRGHSTYPTDVAYKIPDDPLVREAHRLICVRGFPVRDIGLFIEHDLRAWLDVHDTRHYNTRDQRHANHHHMIDQALAGACALWQRGLKEPMNEPLPESDPQTRNPPLVGSTSTARGSIEAPIELER